ncbi:MAG: ribosome biogenesis factor YjgA [Pseudomonadota bacterium]
MADAPSKSAQKREQQALKAITRELLSLPPDTLARVPLDEAVAAALAEAKSMKAHGALRRQRQLVVKLLRQSDVAPVQEALAKLRSADRNSKGLFKLAEAWRDRIAAEGQTALDAFRNTYTDIDPGVDEAARRLETCSNPAQERRIKRQLFRAIHLTLEAGMHPPSR